MHNEKPAEEKPRIQFTVEVPRVPEEIQIYKLEPTRPPLEFLNERLGALKLPALKLEQKAYISRGATGQEDRDRVRAFVDPVSGDLHLIPNLAELAHAPRPERQIRLEDAQKLAGSVLRDERFIPKDVTELRVSEPITVRGGATPRARVGEKTEVAGRTEARTVFTIHPANRYAGGFRVYGRGSQAVVSVASDGAIVGALRRWRTASPGEHVRASITAEQVRAEIERQLRSQLSREGDRVIVDKIEVAYYDHNQKFLQPVFRFEATAKPAEKKIADIKVAGYVPIVKGLEPVPDLAAPPEGEPPAKPKEKASLRERLENVTAGVPGDISLGEYVNQDWPNNGWYVEMSNSFLSGLTFLDSIFPGLTPPVSRTQWYVAYPWEVVGPLSQYFLNAVNVAYTVPHGNWLINTTLSNCCDTWYVPNIGTGGNPGFGAAAGGVLATWVIMSCEVIPSMYDRQNEAGGTGNPYTAFDAWFPVFQGLHNAIGFRTVMFYPDDALQFGFGYDASLGGDLNAAWFQEVAAVDGNDGEYNDGHLIGNPLVHYDRASTMIDARDLGQSIFNVAGQSASTELWNFWMDN